MAKKQLKDRAYDELKRRILAGDIPPGEFLEERALESMLGMSRTPIRGALQRLEMEDLVHYTPNRGLSVAELSIKRAVDVYYFRIALESYVARKLSNRTWSDDEIEHVASILNRQRESMENKDCTRFTEEDWEFHRALISIYGNKEIIQSMERIQDSLFQIALRVLQKDEGRIGVSLDDHEQIFHSILTGEPERAAEKTMQHLEFGRQILIM